MIRGDQIWVVVVVVAFVFFGGAGGGEGGCEVKMVDGKTTGVAFFEKAYRSVPLNKAPRRN